MQRKANIFLNHWVTKIDRKPLIINGARQIGKSWLVKNLGKNHFKITFIELDFI